MAIGKLIRENAALAVGILLPVIVVVFFLLATFVPRWLVDPPQYDFVFTQDSQYADDLPRWRHAVDVNASNRLRVRAFPTKENEYAWRPRVYVYEHATGEVREVRLPTPDLADDAEEGVVVTVAEFEGVFVDSRRAAPDGYEVLNRSGRQGELMGLFYRGNRDDLAIGKSGTVVAVDTGQERDRYYYNPQFVGWIIPSANE